MIIITIIIFIKCITALPSLFSQRLEVRAQVAQAFLSKFQLSTTEMSTLRSARDGPITEVTSCYHTKNCLSSHIKVQLITKAHK